MAIDVARAAVREQAESVAMYCLESRDEMPALDEEIQEAESEGITIHNSWGPKELVVEDGRIKAVTFRRCVSVFDDNHRFDPTYDNSDTITVDADWVLLSIGQEIRWGGLLEGSAVELGRGKTAKADSFTWQTASPMYSWVATAAPDPSSPLTPSPPASRAPSPSTAMCGRA